MEIVNVAVILAGGKGDRLRPYTNKIPKVLIKVFGKPIVQWQIEWLKKNGIRKIVFALGYKHNAIQRFIKRKNNFGIKIDYSIEQVVLGTGGALKKSLENKLIKNEENLLVLNGDIMTTIDLHKMIKQHFENKARITMLAVPYQSRYGVLRFNKHFRVVQHATYPILPYWINGGIFVMNKTFIRDFLPQKGDQEKFLFDVVPAGTIHAFRAENFWRAIDTPKDKMEAEKILQELSKKIK